jgi:hypothetical protein
MSKTQLYGIDEFRKITEPCVGGGATDHARASVN